ncbi:hypothetical protein GBA52_012265, partial [Prunus armeniaca]
PCCCRKSTSVVQRCPCAEWCPEFQIELGICRGELNRCQRPLAIKPLRLETASLESDSTITVWS